MGSSKTIFFLNKFYKSTAPNVFVWGQDKGYTVKYGPSSKEFQRARAIFFCYIILRSLTYSSVVWNTSGVCSHIEHILKTYQGAKIHVTVQFVLQPSLTSVLQIWLSRYPENLWPNGKDVWQRSRRLQIRVLPGSFFMLEFMFQFKLQPSL